MRRTLHCFFFWLLSAVVLGGCAPQTHLTVAVHPWIGYESLCLAQDLGWLPREVRLRHGHTALDSLAALKAGQVDAATLTLDEVLQARSAGVPLSVVLVMDSSAGGDVLMVRQGITTLAALSGKRIGYEHTAVGELVLSEVLAQAGLSPDAIEHVHLPIAEQVAAWRAGAVDAIVTYEPVASRLRAEGAQPLFDSRQMPDTIFDVLAVRRDRLAERHRALHLLTQTHFRVLEYLQSNREDAVYRIAEHQGVTAADVRRALSGVILPNLAGNHYALRSGSRFEQAAERLERLMVQRELLPTPDDLKHLFVDDYLPPAGEYGS
ncbi:ABC transporter substrate-binding protein [Immundisolibacter sp.]|uniref:ABC transporter substrate-binding protein n=1 Tax=Immundisolibacter sp. TaxID=1934948 RepID=UPI003F83F876